MTAGSASSTDQTNGTRLVTHPPTLYALGETLEEVARSVLELVTRTRLIVVGNSIGGSCALEVATAAAPTPQLSDDMARRAQRGVPRIVPNCGHYVPIEQPAALRWILDETIRSTGGNRRTSDTPAGVSIDLDTTPLSERRVHGRRNPLPPRITGQLVVHAVHDIGDRHTSVEVD